MYRTDHISRKFSKILTNSFFITLVIFIKMKFEYNFKCTIFNVSLKKKLYPTKIKIQWKR